MALFQTAGKNPDKVLAQQEFYDEILDSANKVITQRLLTKGQDAFSG